MKKLLSITLMIVGFLLVFTACAPQAPGQTASPTVPSGIATGIVLTPAPQGSPIPPSGTVTGSLVTPAPQVTPTEAQPGAGKEVTLADQGKTFTLAVGERFLLKLGEIYIWDIQISDQSVLSRVKNIAVVQGAQGIYEALKPGTVTLSAAGDPVCRQSKPPCMMPSILFSATVIVR